MKNKTLYERAMPGLLVWLESSRIEGGPTTATVILILSVGLLLASIVVVAEPLNEMRSGVPLNGSYTVTVHGRYSYAPVRTETRQVLPELEGAAALALSGGLCLLPVLAYGSGRLERYRDPELEACANRFHW